MGYFILRTTISDLSVCAYLISKEVIRVICVTPGKRYSSLALRWQYRYSNNNIYTTSVSNIISSNRQNDIWEIVLNVSKLDVNFVVEATDNSTVWFSEIGKHDDFEEALCFSLIIPKIRDFELERFLPVETSWLRGATLYQIFVDRYRRHEENEAYRCWQMAPPKDDFFHKTIYGGSIQGVIHSIVFDGNYLKELGIGGIYLTPVFKSPSNHKYDTSDYYNIDEQFGNIDDMQEFVQAAHDNDIRVILDGVFNHCSDTLKVWEDVDRTQSISLFEHIKDNGKDSIYHNWLLWKSESQWEGFAGLRHIPILNTEDQECSKYLIEAAKYWTSQLNIDGWRLDVANELSHGFISKLKSELSDINPNIWLLGEILHDGSRWLNKDELSATTNHHWREAVIRYLNNEWSSSDFDIKIQSLWIRYPSNSYSGIVNYLSNHDTARIMTELDKGQDYEVLVNMSCIAAILLFTSLGVPLVYYGDEIGMEGEKDPDSRRCMEWDVNHWDQQSVSNRGYIKELYAKLITLRKKMPWLDTGVWQTIYSGGDALYIYKRQNRSTFSCSCDDLQEIIVILNPSDKEVRLQLGYNICISNKYFEIITEKSITIDQLRQYSIPAYSGRIFSSL